MSTSSRASTRPTASTSSSRSPTTTTRCPTNRNCSTSRRPSAARRATSTASAWMTARVDYFDEGGQSAKQFLLRKPVPNGQFRSGFGPRRHPILGYVRMHTGTRLGRTRRNADHRGRQWRRREGRLVRRLWPADDHPPRQRLRELLQSPERLRQGRQCRAPRPAGPGDRLYRHHRPVDRTASALRADRQRHQGRPDARAPAGRAAR